MTSQSESGRRSPDEALDTLRSEAEAGAPEAWLAEQADVSVRAVRAWKKRRGLPISEQGVVAENVAALQGLAPFYDPRQHRTVGAPDFDTPEFVLRLPLDYTQYARACHTLELARFSVAQIASGTGTKPKDVEVALAMWRRHLSSKGQRCLGCNLLLDHRFSEFCSRTCYDAAIRK